MEIENLDKNDENVEIANRNFIKLSDNLKNRGYADGKADGKASVFQKYFDEAYEKGFEVGFKRGQSLGHDIALNQINLNKTDIVEKF